MLYFKATDLQVKLESLRETHKFTTQVENLDRQAQNSQGVDSHRKRFYVQPKNG